MATIKIKDLVSEIANFSAPCATIAITASTAADYNKGRGATSMVATLNIEPDSLRNLWTQRVLVTRLPYKALLNNRAAKEIASALHEAQIAIEDEEVQLELAAIAEKEQAAAVAVEAKARTNGTTINGALALSAKDGSAMLTYYPIFGGGSRVLMVGDRPATPEEIAALAAYLPPKKEEGSSTQRAMGLKKKLPSRSLRLENILEWNGAIVTPN